MKAPPFICGWLFSSVYLPRDWIPASLFLPLPPSSSAHFSYFSDSNNSKKLTPAGVRAVRGGAVIREKYGLYAGAVAPLPLASRCCFHLLALSQWSSGEPGGLQRYQTGAARGGGRKQSPLYLHKACTCARVSPCVGMGLGPGVRNVLLPA